MKETVGAVIATYNGEKYVDQQLMSIINQDRKPDLIVISDGGSSDRTVEICREILSSSEIKYIILTSDTQLSVPINFGKAIENCCCDYIFLSDQDDYWVKDKISVTLKAMANNDVCMAFTNATITDGALNHKGTTLWDTIGFKPEDEITVFEKNDFDFSEEYEEEPKQNSTQSSQNSSTSENKEIKDLNETLNVLEKQLSEIEDSN